MSTTASSRTAVEIASQPDTWLRARDSLALYSDVLPRRGERVAVVGCGTSWFMALAYAELRERGGHGETHAFAASEFPHGRRYDRVLAISRSGTTTEVLEVLDRVKGTTPTGAVTADAETPVMRAADGVAVLDFADEESVVQTRFATTTLALLRAHLEASGALPADVLPIERAAADAPVSSRPSHRRVRATRTGTTATSPVSGSTRTPVTGTAWCTTSSPPSPSVTASTSTASTTRSPRTRAAPGRSRTT